MQMTIRHNRHTTILLLTAAVLLLTAVPLFSQVPKPTPAKSSIAVAETTTRIPAPTPAPGSRCMLAHNLTAYSPTIVLGGDAATGDLTWRFFVAVKTPYGEGLDLVREKTFVAGKVPRIPAFTADAGVWECSCCRKTNKDSPKILGWYSELERDGKVIATAQAPLSSAVTKLVSGRSPVPGATPGQVGAMLNFYPVPIDVSKNPSVFLRVKPQEVIRIVTPSGAKALVQFTGPGKSSAYRWKYQAAPTKPVEEGEGVVPPKGEGEYTSPSIEAGDISIRWNEPGSNVHYAPELAKVEVLPATAFDAAL